MRYAAAYLLAVLGGNSSPDVAAIAKILGSVGIECDQNRAQKVVDACKGRDVNEIIAGGMIKIDGVLTNTSVGTTGPTGGNITVPVINTEPPLEPNSPTPPGSGRESPTFVSSYFHPTFFILINMLLFIFDRWVCSIDTNLSNLGKNQSKQELQVIILSCFFLLYNNKNKIWTYFVKYEILC
jgi:large subunit ribosomal protein LP2